MKRAVRFEFAASKNAAKSEALILCLNICYEAGARTLSVFSDFQLLVGQVNREFKAKDDSMKMYMIKVKYFVAKFDKFSLTHVPRSANSQADSLARLESSAKTSDARDSIWEVLPNSSINVMVSTINRSETWMEHSIKYLQKTSSQRMKRNSKPIEESKMV